jgi:acyl-CoA synthetase (NDP forming)
MAHDKTAVRKILDKVKAEGRTSLTAPEGRFVCDAYGIPVPQEGVAKSAAEAAKLASEMGFPVVLKIVSRSRASRRSWTTRRSTTRRRISSACRFSRCSRAARK